jgi:glycosyltransferase involved in cell wall biosynthesis
MISAVIPAYNEASRICATIAAVQPYVDEIVVVDDGSEDGTAAIARAASARVISQANAGYIAAIKRGFQEARGEIVVTIDADGEFPADALSELVRPIQAGDADMVQGHRSAIPRSSERFLSWLANRRCAVGDTGTGLRALRSDLARQLEIRGACICGVLALEAVSKGAHLAEIQIKLQEIQKPRRIAWYHVRQFFYLLPWLLKRYPSRA